MSFLEIDQYSFSPGPHTLTIAFNITTGRKGQFQYNFTGQVRLRKSLFNVILTSRLTIHVFLLIAAVFELPSVEGVIDIIEGGQYEEELRFRGFSYGSVPIRVYSLTYSEYAARGFNLEDDFDSNVIPANPANGLLLRYNITN